MTGKLFIKPAVAGSIVRQPDRDMRPLDQSGEWVVDNILWRRRLRNGDVVETDPPAPVAPVAPVSPPSPSSPAAAPSAKI